MIRRGFWLAAGAVLGVTGYRRVTRLARVLTGPHPLGIRSLPGTGPTAGPQLLAPPARARSQVSRAVAAARFVRDVRDGMAEYRDLNRGEPDAARRGPALESRTLETQSYRTSSGDSQQGRREL